jgi:hypothetical protein
VWFSLRLNASRSAPLDPLVDQRKSTSGNTLVKCQGRRMPDTALPDKEGSGECGIHLSVPIQVRTLVFDDGREEKFDKECRAMRLSKIEENGVSHYN